MTEIEQATFDYCSLVGSFHKDCSDTVNEMKKNRDEATKNAETYAKKVEEFEKWLDSPLP